MKNINTVKSHTNIDKLIKPIQFGKCCAFRNHLVILGYIIHGPKVLKRKPDVNICIVSYKPMLVGIKSLIKKVI